jgi:hypothetical protein
MRASSRDQRVLEMVNSDTRSDAGSPERGIDSSTITALVSKPYELKTFSFGPFTLHTTSSV